MDWRGDGNAPRILRRRLPNRRRLERRHVSGGKKPQEGRRSRKRRANLDGNNTLKWQCRLNFVCRAFVYVCNLFVRLYESVCILKLAIDRKPHEGRRGVKQRPCHQGRKPWRGKGSGELRALVGLNHQPTVTDSHTE